MKSLFLLAIKLMDQVSYPIKFGIIFVLALIPLLFFGLLLINSINADIEFSANERIGIEYIQEVRRVIEPLQVHRGLSAAIANGESQFQSRWKAVGTDVNTALEALREIDARLGVSLETENRVQRISDQWQAILRAAQTLTKQETVAKHSQIVAELLTLMTQAADTSGITLDPSLDGYYLGDVMVNNLPDMIESMGLARALGSSIAAASTITPDEYIQLSVLSDNFIKLSAATAKELNTAFAINAELSRQLNSASSNTETAVISIETLIKTRILEPDNITISSAQVFDAATTAIGNSYTLFDAIIPTLDTLLANRITNNQNARLLYLSIILGMCVAVAYFFTGLYLSIRDSIQRIGKVASQVAEGNLNVQLNLATKDELQDIATQFNLMITRFNQLIHQLSGATNQMAAAAEQLSISSRESTASIQQQSQETESISTAINEMQRTVAEVAANTAVAAQSTQKVDEETQSSMEVVLSTSQAVNGLASELKSSVNVILELENDSESIGTILDVIKAIAEQTNLLALNAAIEAARAGEQGRGFAVVADEVRTLASRTQESTLEIERTIAKLQDGSKKAVTAMNASNVKAKEGVERAEKAAEALKAITQGIGNISDMNTQVASAAEEQTSVTEEINQNISRITGISQQTSVSANQTSSAAAELAKLSSDLQSLVGQFKLADL